MKVSLTYNNNKLMSISFEGWQEDRGRMANIDLAIVKALGSCSTRSWPSSDTKIFEPIRGEWGKADEEKIKKVLAGYCIEPEVRHTADCNCQAEYGETCSLSFMSGKVT